MATPQEELMKMLESMRTPGMTRTANTAPGTASGTNRNGTPISATFTGGDTANVRRPGMTAGRSSVGTAPTGGRVARNARVAQSGVQRSRNSAEAKLNPEIGEALRLSLIEQQRVSGPTYGSQGAFDRRDRREAQAAAQTAVDSNLSALQGIREGALMERGQTLEATGALEDRQMQEAGAFDRALLGLDESMLKGQFGLAGIAAEKADPLRDLAVDVITQQVAGENATALDRMNAVNAALRLGPQSGVGPAYTRKIGPQGIEYEGSGPLPTGAVLQEYQRLGGNTPEGQAWLTAQGYAFDDKGRLITLEESDARATAAEEAENNLDRALKWLEENERFQAQQQRNRGTDPIQQRLRRGATYPTLYTNPPPPGGVR